MILDGELTGGNAAGIVLQDTDKKQEIAAKLAFSETVFVTGYEPLTFRYFTPNKEIDICGHATIATLGYLSSQKMIPSNAILVTNAG